MQIDVVYRLPDSNIWQNINRFVKAETVDLVFFTASSDNYVNKKTIWNAASRIMLSGIFCVKTESENISFIINIFTSLKMNYLVRHFIINNNIETYVIAYKNSLYRPDIKSLTFLDTHEQLNSLLLTLTDFGNIVLCIDNDSLPLMEKAKILGRHVIGFGNNDNLINKILLQGIKEVTDEHQ